MNELSVCTVQIFELIMDKTKSGDLSQARYLISKVYEFEKERKPELEAELSTIRAPSRIFSWRQKIWRPKNWILSRTYNDSGESMRIHPLEFGTEPYTFSGNRSNGYTLEKEIVRQTTTRYPFWRRINFFNR